MEPKFKYSSYKQRGYHCEICPTEIIVYETAPAPKVCPRCGATEDKITERWSNSTSTQTTILPDAKPV